MNTYPCAHCGSGGRCSCQDCLNKAKITYGVAVCSACSGKGFHWSPFSHSEYHEPVNQERLPEVPENYKDYECKP